MDILLDYGFLRAVWWFLVGVLFFAFATMNGMDLGVAAISSVFFKKDEHRRVLLNTVGPVWEGNQVWLILGAGALFAAWPLFYSVLFSGLYLAMFGVLCALILRPVGFKFRSKMSSKTWRTVWDVCIGIGGIVPALGFGLVMGTMVSGIDFYFQDDLRLFVTHHPQHLLHPLALVSGLLWLLLFVTHGGIYLTMKTQGEICAKLQKALPLRLWVSILLFFTLLCVWQITIPQHIVIGVHDGPSNPLLKSVMMLPRMEGWFPSQPFMWVSFLMFTTLTVLTALVMHRRPGIAFTLSALRMATVIFSMGYGAFPFVLFSVTHPGHSLTVWDASSSKLTLVILLVAAVLFVPLMIVAAQWVYRVLRGPVTVEGVNKNKDHWY